MYKDGEAAHLRMRVKCCVADSHALGFRCVATEIGMVEAVLSIHNRSMGHIGFHRCVGQDRSRVFRA